MAKKTKYFSPEVSVTLIKNVDIITYSETEEWAGPTVGAEKKPEIGTEN